MQRRTFFKTTIGAAVAAAIPGWRSAISSTGADIGGSISAISSSGEELSIEAAAIRELAEGLDGQLFVQSSAGYDSAKQIWNGMFDQRKPAVVVKGTTIDDVVDAVNFARERNLLVSVKCGGHSLPGKSTCDGGMMIDLSPMHTVDADPREMTMRADGGCLLGHLDNAALAHNTLTTTGIVSHTGAGGFTLGGGFGRTDRKMGLAVDNLLGATIVTASGEVVRANAEENADLYWGLRGGGGNFGIAVEFIYRLHPFNPIVYGGTLIYKADKDFLNFYAEFNVNAPDEVNIEPNFVPDEDGSTVAAVEVTWCGDHAAGKKSLAPLLTLPGLIRGELAPFSYHDIQTSADTFLGHGRQYYLKSGLLAALTPEVIDVIAEYAQAGLAGSWFQHLGGASSRVAPDATAYWHRNAAFNFGVMYVGDDPANNANGIAGVREFYKAVEPYMIGFYTNLNEDTEQKTWGNYGPNYPRLVELKNRFDPTNLFHLNANIKPTA